MASFFQCQRKVEIIFYFPSDTQRGSQTHDHRLPPNSHNFYTHHKYKGGGILIKMVPNFIFLGRGIFIYACIKIGRIDRIGKSI